MSFFSHVAHLFGFSATFSLFPYFAPKLFCFLFIRLLCLRTFSTYLLIEFVLFVLECPGNVLFCLECVILSRYLFSLPYFACTFWLIFSSCNFCFTYVAFFFSSQHILAFSLCLIIFACCHKLLICVSNRFSHQRFEFLFLLSMGTLILSDYFCSYMC